MEKGKFGKKIRYIKRSCLTRRQSTKNPRSSWRSNDEKGAILKGGLLKKFGVPLKSRAWPNCERIGSLSGKLLVTAKLPRKTEWRKSGTVRKVEKKVQRVPQWQIQRDLSTPHPHKKDTGGGLRGKKKLMVGPPQPCKGWLAGFLRSTTLVR